MNSFIGWKSVLFGLVGSVVLSYWVSIPSPITPIHIHLPSPPYLRGALALNDILQNCEKIGENILIGAESMVLLNGSIYTGLLNGSIMKIDSEKVITEIARFDTKCSMAESGQQCARPLGLRVTPKGDELYVIESYSGVYKIAPTTGQLQRVFPSYSTAANRLQVKMLNDLVVLPDGSLIVTESSRRFPLHSLSYDVLEGIPTGRIYHVNVVTGQYEVLTDALHFPNGVEIDVTSLTESLRGLSVLVSEATSMRIVRVRVYDEFNSTEGSLRRGQFEVWNDALPGLPDNIRVQQPIQSRKARFSTATSYWVGVSSLRHAEMNLPVMDWLAEYPKVRKWIPRILAPQTLLRLIHSFGGSRHGLVVGLNTRGEIVETLHDPSGEIRGISEVLEDDKGNLYFGSYYRPFLAFLAQNYYRK